MAPRVLASWRPLIVVGVAWVVLLAACGGDSTSGDAATDQPDEAAPISTGTVSRDEDVTESSRQELGEQQPAQTAPARDPEPTTTTIGKSPQEVAEQQPAQTAPAPDPEPTTTIGQSGSGANPAPAPAPAPTPPVQPQRAPEPPPPPYVNPDVLRTPAERLRAERGVLNERGVASGAVGGLLGEFDEYLVYDNRSDGVSGMEWTALMQDVFYGALRFDQGAARSDRSKALRDSDRRVRRVFASPLCVTTRPGEPSDLPPDLSHPHHVRVTTLWRTVYADGEATPAATAQEFTVARTTRRDRWYVVAVGPRQELSTSGVAEELSSCQPTLDGDSLAADANYLAWPQISAPAAAARIFGLLQYAAPGATADLAEWERAVVASAAEHDAERARTMAWDERDEMAQAGVWTLLRSPVCHIDRAAREPAGEGLSQPRLVELLVEQWFIYADGIAHEEGPVLTAVPMARTEDGRWVQYAAQQPVIEDTSATALADAVARHLASCSAY